MKKILFIFCLVPVSNFLFSQITCSSESFLLDDSLTFTAAQSGGNGLQSYVADGDLQELNYWETTAADQSVTIDYMQDYIMNGLTYYPSTSGNTVLGYTVQTSTDNVNFSTVASGSFPTYTTTNLARKGIPTTIKFTNPTTVRYLRMIVADSGKRVAEIIPIVCGQPPVTVQCNTGSLTSSGTNSTGTAKKAIRKLDNNWTVTHIIGGTGAPETSPYNYSSQQNALYYPAMVVGQAVGVWTTSPYNNAEWISATQDGEEINSINQANNPAYPNTYFYKYKFKIVDSDFATSLKLRLDYYVDNQIVRVYVNGVDQNINSLDSSSYLGGHQKTSLLESDFVLGENELVVQVYSWPGYQGLLVQGIPSCYCLKDANTAYPGKVVNHGITLLNRAGSDVNNNNWPMVRKSGFTALESNTKGMVVTRMTTAALTNITRPIEGMMVFDVTAKCLKIYDGTGWKCFVTPSCPD